MATSFGLNGPSSDQYLQKHKKADAYIDVFILYVPAFLRFYIYWSDDGQQGQR
jgi:hypothetical protein